MADRTRVDGVGLLTAAGVLLTGYSYLGPLWLNRHGWTPDWLLVLREWANQPLALGQDFGFLGAALLLLAAGYRVTGVLLGDGPRALPRLLLTGYAPVLAAVVLAAATEHLGGTPLTFPARPSGGVTHAVLLVAPLTGGPVLLGLGWLATAAAVHLLLSCALLPVLRRAPWAAVLVLLAVLALVTVLGAGGSGAGHRAGELAALLVLPMFGQLLRLRRDGRLAGTVGTPVALAGLALLIWADSAYPEFHGWWYPMAAAYAGLLGLLAAPRGGGPLGGTAVVRWLATRAAWLVLLAGAAGYPVLDALGAPLGYPAALLVTGLLAEAGHRAAGAVRTRRVEVPG